MHQNTLRIIKEGTKLENQKTQSKNLKIKQMTVGLHKTHRKNKKCTIKNSKINKEEPKMNNKKAQ